MKYKVGDKVRIKSDLERGKSYYMYGSDEWATCNSTMISHSGSIATISECCIGQYRLCEFGYFWTDEMFDGLYSDLPDIAIENLI